MHAAPGSTPGARGRPLRPRRAIALALGLSAALGAVTASAQAPVPAGNYGGGAIVGSPKSIQGPGSMIMSLRATGNGKVQIFAGMAARCEIAAIKTTATLAPDGSFSASGTATERPGGGVRLRSPYVITGTLNVGSASGTASAKGSVRQRGRATRSCKTGAVQWSVRRPTGDIGTPGAAVPGDRYGTTSQTFSGRRHALILRVSDQGTRLARALYSAKLRCPGGAVVGAGFPRPNLAIGSDGKVSNVKHDSEKVDRRTRVRTTERFKATIGANGASGTLSVSARVIDIPSDRTIGRCSSGTVKWTAAL